jgi:endoglucanase
VYAVDGESLRWIVDDETAIDVYGEHWADYVIDLPPTLFPHFKTGNVISEEDFVETVAMKTRFELISQEAIQENTVVVSSASSPFASATFYVDQNSSAAKQVASWQSSHLSDAEALEKISSQPTARWFGDWNSDIQTDVEKYVATVTATGSLPVLVAYNIPNRDCGSYSAGGASSNEKYLTWIRDFASGIGDRSAVVVLEPDATATSCVTDERLVLIGEAVKIFKSRSNIAVYIDAGHDSWIDADTMAERLEKANIVEADGFALNVSNFYTTAENTAYGTAVSERVGDKHFIIDTSRNGNGWNGEWCNPSGRKIGQTPTTETGNELIDALLWIKPPGESDGTCNGGPNAGSWWAEYALGLVR